jgi:tryptophan-rich sensory protein
MVSASRSRGLSPAWAAALAIGTVTAALLVGKRAGPTPDHPRTLWWFLRLEKPGFTPPSPVYPIAWTGIEASLAYAGYRLLRADPAPQRTTALALWTANQVGIAGWSAVFFGRRAPGWGALASAALGAGAAAYISFARHTDKVAARLGTPLMVWVAFATLLSEEIWRRNEP